MLAKRVRVNIYGELSENLYSGYADAQGMKNTPAYVISNGNVRDYLVGVVIAVITVKGVGEKLVVAPTGCVYYEPDIREYLSSLNSVEIEKINCLYEKSCGAIIVYKDKNSDNSYKVLLVRNNNGRNYSFPKGHVEKGETEEQTAIREIKEETGLDVEIVDSFREVSDYCPFGNIKKRVVFFMAQAFTDKVVIQKEEIDSYKWVDLFEAHNICTYENDLRVIKKAKENLDKLK